MGSDFACERLEQKIRSWIFGQRPPGFALPLLAKSDLFLYNLERNQHFNRPYNNGSLKS
jgi:hypothetical protein